MNEYKRINRTLVKSGAIIDYYQDTILLPDGAEKTYDFIDHKGAAAVVPVLPDGRIIMVRQERNAVDEESLEIPAGGKNQGEEFVAAAARELEEETGYRCEVISHLFDLYTTVAFSNEKIGIYLAEDLIPSKQNLDEDEYLSVEIYSLEELQNMITDGRIHDAKTIAALMYYKAIKGK